MSESRVNPPVAGSTQAQYSYRSETGWTIILTFYLTESGPRVDMGIPIPTEGTRNVFLSQTELPRFIQWMKECHQDFSSWKKA